jgi:hypothetical protein
MLILHIIGPKLYITHSDYAVFPSLRGASVRAATKIASLRPKGTMTVRKVNE